MSNRLREFLEGVTPGPDGGLVGGTATVNVSADAIGPAADAEGSLTFSMRGMKADEITVEASLGLMWEAGKKVGYAEGWNAALRAMGVPEPEVADD